MTSERKIKANRTNARASTGPKTAQGRARVARDAFRHGLSLPVYLDPALATQKLAQRVAEAQIDLHRVRYVRYQLLSRALSDPYYGSRQNMRQKVLLGPNATEMTLEALTKDLTSAPEGPEKFASILSQEADQLVAMDRYERRARYRRKVAVRAFDEARQRQS